MRRRNEEEKKERRKEREREKERKKERKKVRKKERKKQERKRERKKERKKERKNERTNERKKERKKKRPSLDEQTCCRRLLSLPLISRLTFSPFLSHTTNQRRTSACSNGEMNNPKNRHAKTFFNIL